MLGQLTVEGVDHLHGVMRRYGRALVLSAHLGNWELLAAAHRVAGYPLAVVVRPLDVPWLNALAVRFRQKAGVELIAKRGALRPVLRALEAGRLVAVLLDQNASRSDGLFVPFFGRLASTSRSLAVLSLRTGTPIVPIFIRREAGHRHRVSIHPPLADVPDGPLEARVAAVTARCAEAIEAAIRAMPDQWLWMHNRWRTRPAGGDAGARPA